MSIADVIRKRRRELDLTLKDIANKVGVSEATVQRWESGVITNIRFVPLVIYAQYTKK